MREGTILRCSKITTRFLLAALLSAQTPIAARCFPNINDVDEQVDVDVDVGIEMLGGGCTAYPDCRPSPLFNILLNLQFSRCLMRTQFGLKVMWQQPQPSLHGCELLHAHRRL